MRKETLFPENDAYDLARHGKFSRVRGLRLKTANENQMNWLADIDEALEQRNSQQRRLLMIIKGKGDW